MSNDIKPFHCGTQYMDWDAANCQRCKKNIDFNNSEFKCDIQADLFGACLTDGKVPYEIGRRMGAVDNPTAYQWACPEVEWTEEWKQQCENNGGNQ